MRELKFRAWDKQRKKYFTSPKWVEFSVNCNGEMTAKNYSFEHNEQLLVIEQFTGLKDKNGVEIYEGDKVKITPVTPFSKLGNTDFTGTVIYLEGSFWVDSGNTAVLLFQECDFIEVL